MSVSGGFYSKVYDDDCISNVWKGCRIVEMMD